jgi:hypothetical protein
MHDRMIGSAFAKAKRSYETSFQEAGKAINEKVRLYAKVGQALIEAKETGNDPLVAIEQILSWLSAWHIRDETYSKALAGIVNYHRRPPLATHWGEGTTSSPDGQRFRAGGRGEEAGQVNLRYGTEPGACCSTRTYRTSTRPSTPRLSMRPCVMLFTCLTGYSITNPI